MTNITLNLPFLYTFKLSFGKRRKRHGEAFLLDKLHQLGKIRSGNKFSRATRLLLERFNVKSFLGKNIAFAALTASLLAPVGNTLEQSNLNQTPVETQILTVADKLTTDIAIHYPFRKPKLNQGFSFFHAGLDLGGNSGEPVYPIENGVVEFTESNKFGYGNTIVIDHKNGLKSRYAHLTKIEVKTGDEVYTKTEIGTLGSTGHSTGPHVHLEVYREGKTIDPRAILGPVENPR